MENKLKNKKLRVSFSLIPRYIYNKLDNKLDKKLDNKKINILSNL